ncbi:hypothetical protein [Mycolicibacterium sp. D5.8-2]|uniref:hypothetical protein n=1 Tax=Mycolicibacterium sp. D5.8-2 TaxID=3085903 RepID=UPI00298CD8D3|nr:hypothetical protein [Mycolicibacterium sp. D5.8-2]MDW5610443.1 hypothetical protein [Mycolicibacterium sp. D5.8-2]
MTTTWTVTRTERHSHHSIIGASDNPDHARRQLYAVTAALIRRARADERPRYTLHIGEQLTAIIQTGDDRHGRPDHAATAELLTCMQHTGNPFGA